MSQIDVYKEWLGIEETNRPLNYYQLLKLNQFEDNSGAIRKQYRQLNAHVRKYASGEFGAESQALLNELAKAMLCLTDQERKAEYDASLGRKEGKTQRRRTLEDLLLLNKIVPEDRMKQIKNYADAIGIDLHQAVLQQKVAKPEIVMLAFAESIGLPFFSLDDIGIDETLVPQVNPNTARQHSFVPVMIDQGRLIIASPTPVNPDVEEELKMIFDVPVRCAICTPNQINDAITKYYPKDAVQMIAKSGAKPAAPKTEAKQKPAKKEKAAKSEASPVPLTEDEYEARAKQRLQYSIIAFCLPLMCCGMAATFLNFSGTYFHYFLGGGVLLGGIIGGITWKTMK